LKKKVSSPEIDVLSYYLLPEMKVLGEAEKTKVLKKFGIGDTQLPKMYSSDPAAVALKAVPGNVIRMERNDGTSKYTAYRIVVEE